MEKERPPREAMRTESPTVSREEQELDKTRTFFLALEVPKSSCPSLAFVLFLAMAAECLVVVHFLS